MKKTDFIRKMCEEAQTASRALALTGQNKKSVCLKAMAKALTGNAALIIRENAKDLARAKGKGTSKALIDRLSLDAKRIDSMARSLVEISSLEDPVGKVMEQVTRPNGLLIKKVRVPIGVILIIYEARPNVTSDCIGLCVKSGNAVVLRGGSDAINSNMAIFDILNKAAIKHGLPKGSLSLVRDTDRKIVDMLLKQDGLIDLVIPRGGESLIREVTKTSRIPVIKHYKGVCHVYVDKRADLAMAREICFNAKIQRPGVCNAMETMLVHRDVAKAFLPAMIERLRLAGVEIRGCPVTRAAASGVKPARESDWYEEYLGLILALKVVKNLDEAVRHIMKYGSNHSDAIVTADKKTAEKFLYEVDSAVVYVNASTRFTDGGEFGKGAEMGISTDKIHARGPMVWRS